MKEERKAILLSLREVKLILQWYEHQRAFFLGFPDEASLYLHLKGVCKEMEVEEDVQRATG